MIGRYAFEGCNGLTSITLPDGVTEIMECAITFCDSLRSVTLPASLSEIGGSVFYYCDRLTDISFAGSGEQWEKLTKRLKLSDSVNVQCGA